MNKLFGFISAALMAVNMVSAAPNMANCSCEKCECTQAKHCGCNAVTSTKPSTCTENCQCGVNCPCGSDCSCK